MTANNSAPRVALVTGGADGIGLATGIVLARDGYRVAIADLQIDLARQRATDLGSGHLALRCDVSSETDVAAAMVEIEKTYGRLDAVVNNAGVGAPHLPTFEQTVEAFERVLHIHLTGTFLVSREALKLMTAARADGAGGAVVNVSSIAGLVGMPRRNAYGAAKAGIASMTRSMACEFARYGVRVNAVAPGFVATALVRKLARDGFVDTKRLASRVPMGRLGQPEEIAEAIAFLCSPRASYINGTVLGVDGGWAAFGDAGLAADVPADAN
jgi:NAD(P)-dependent dehydrogenase (short-subunit alcohol dehydrogenase family)